MCPEAKYQVTLRGHAPVDLAQKIAKAHTLAIRNGSVHAAYQARALVMPIQDNPDETEKAAEIDSEGFDGGEEA